MSKIFHKIIRSLYKSTLIALCLIPMFANSSNIYHAKVINNPLKIIDTDLSKEFVYNFKISDKLIGNGDIKLTINGDKITGFASGLGMTCQCNVDLKTEISGEINKHDGSIVINVSGIGDPLGIPIPGKVTFKGPLNAFPENEKISLIGKVEISGRLARYGGFNNIEDLVIEIPDVYLSKRFIELQSKKNLASL